MAHLRSIERDCYHCGKRATVALYTYQNEKLGDYCNPCGKREEKALKAKELKQSVSR